MNPLPTRLPTKMTIKSGKPLYQSSEKAPPVKLAGKLVVFTEPEHNTPFKPTSSTVPFYPKESADKTAKTSSEPISYENEQKLIRSEQAINESMAVDEVRCAFCHRSDGDIVRLKCGTPVHVQCVHNAALDLKILGGGLQDDSKAVKVASKSPATEPVDEPVDHTYRVSPKGTMAGIAIYGADPTTQHAYQKFIREGLGMEEYVPVTIPGGMGKLLSPLSRKFSAAVLDELSSMLKSNEIKRVVCIVTKPDVDSPLVRSLMSIPMGSNPVAYILSLVSKTIKNRFGIDAEFYMADIHADGEIEFFKLDYFKFKE